MEKRKEELEAKGVKYNSSAEYTDGDEYELMLIVKVMDPSFGHYKFDEYKENPTTAKYCELMEIRDELKEEFHKSNEKFSVDTMKEEMFFILGGMAIFISFVFAGSLYMVTKRREIIAFSMQQGAPVVKEGVGKMAPEIAKEIAKGVKEGMKDDDE